MDARERERSQSRRPSIKRPWEEDAVLPEAGNAWFGATLPPIDHQQYRRTSTSRQAEAGGNLHNIYQPDSRDVGAKRVRYEGENDYTPFPDRKLQSQESRKSSRNPAMTTQFLISLPIQRYIIQIRDLLARPLSKSGRAGNPQMLKIPPFCVDDAGG
jgi:hypothetical protein